MTTALTWEQHLARRAARRRRAGDCARRLRLPSAPAALELPLATSLRERMPRAERALIRRLREASPQPGPLELAAALAPEEALPPPVEPLVASESLHHGELAQRLEAAPLPQAPPPPEAPPLPEADPLAWAVSELDRAHRYVIEEQRLGWGAPLPAPPQALKAAELWAAWFSKDPWSSHQVLERRFLPIAARAFKAVCQHRGLPLHVQAHVQRELKDALFFTMLGTKDGVPAWLDVALRTLEYDAEGPLTGLLRHLPAGAWGQVSGCLAGRGYWADTVRALWDKPTTDERALAAARGIAGQGERLQALVDLHLSLRLLHRWDHGLSLDPSAQRRLLNQNLGKVRGRLRALLAENGGDALLPVVLAQPDLEARTCAAFSRFCFSWAWRDITHDFDFNGVNRVTPPCTHSPSLPPPLNPEQQERLNTWLLKVVLKGRVDHLQRWVFEGGTGDQDSTWGRLLSEDLPAELQTSDGDAGRYGRIRCALSMDLSEHLDALVPTLESVTRLRGSSRGLGPPFRALVKPTWHPDVPFPRRDFGELQRNAAAALSGRPAHEEDPWAP